MGDHNGTRIPRQRLGPDVELPAATRADLGDVFHGATAGSLRVLGVAAGSPPDQPVHEWKDVAVVGPAAWPNYVVSADADVPAPYATPQLAIAAAVAAGHGPANPAVVLVHPGAYAGDLTLRAGISVAGLGMDGHGPAATIAGEVFLADEAGPFAIVGLELAAPGAAEICLTTGPSPGVGTTAATPLVIRNCLFTVPVGGAAIQALGDHAQSTVTAWGSRVVAPGAVDPFGAVISGSLAMPVHRFWSCEFVSGGAEVMVNGFGPPIELYDCRVMGLVSADGGGALLTAFACRIEATAHCLTGNNGATVRWIGGQIESGGDPDVVPYVQGVGGFSFEVSDALLTNGRRVGPLAAGVVGNYVERLHSIRSGGALYGPPATFALVQPEAIVCVDTTGLAAPAVVTLPPIGVTANNTRTVVKNVLATATQLLVVAVPAGEFLDGVVDATITVPPGAAVELVCAKDSPAPSWRSLSAPIAADAVLRRVFRFVTVGAAANNTDIPIADGTSVTFVVTANAFDPAAVGRDRAYGIAVTFSRPTGQPLIVNGGAIDIWHNRGGLAATIAAVVSGTNARFTATGVAGTNARWRLAMEIQVNAA